MSGRTALSSRNRVHRQNGRGLAGRFSATGRVVDHADEIYAGHPEPAPVAEKPRWLEVLQQISYGYDRKEVGRRLFIEEQTVMSHLKRARRTLNAKTTLHAVAEALRKGLIE